MDITQNYFELFGLPIDLNVDQSELQSRYRHLQTQFHPDKFSNKSPSEQRLAEQFSAHINTAYQTLCSALATAVYLLALAGKTIDNESLTIKDGAFLLKQMEWREALADMNLSTIDIVETSLDQLIDEVSRERKQLLDNFLFEYSKQDFIACLSTIAKWHFVEKMQNEIEQLQDKLFEANE